MGGGSRVTDIQCQACGARAVDAYLCRIHAADLRSNLAELAGAFDPQTGRATSGWIELLADAATGQVRMGDDGGRRAHREPLGLNGDDDVKQGDAAALQRKFLALGGVNAKASQLLEQIRGMLARWVLDICEQRGATYEPVRPVHPNLIGPLRLHEVRGVRFSGHGADLALWLQIHVAAIIVSEDAGLCFDEVQGAIASIKVAIDRPNPPRFIGPCPTLLDERQRHRLRATNQPDRHYCGHPLRAKREAIEVTCEACGETRNVEREMQRLLARIDGYRFTRAEVIDVMAMLGEPLNERTLRRWRQHGKLKPRGYRRPNGRRGLTRHNEDDEPEFLLSDVRKLKAGERVTA